MARRRTRFSLDNAKVYPTGQDIEAATAAGLVARFDPALLPHQPLVLPPDTLTPDGPVRESPR